MSNDELFFTLYDWGDKKVKNHWWPNFGTFEVVIGAILTQNTKWNKVKKALLNLKEANALDLDGILKIDNKTLATLIKPSGFYNTKAKRLYLLCKNIKNEFIDFENFCQNVSRDWLLSQNGIGEESADSILCYACGKDEMVVDSYTLRILSYLGYEFQSYLEAKEWLSQLDFDRCFKVCKTGSVNEIFCIYHGLIVEFCKENFKGKNIEQSGIEILKNII